MAKTMIAVDPGSVSGAYAFQDQDGAIYVGDLPVVSNQIDAAAFGRLASHAGVAIVESVGPMPKQGLASTFKFGVAVGIIRGVLVGYGIPVHYVSSSIWKKHFNLIGKDKEASRALAILRHPTVPGLEYKKHHGRAEALLMLDYLKEIRP